MTKLQFVGRTIRNLKVRYGVPIDFYRPITNTVDVVTGAITRTYQVIRIKKSLILPTKEKRLFDYDIAYLAANKNFTFGGLFDKGEVTICIDYRDLSLTPQIDDFIIYLQKKWEIKLIKESADTQFYILGVQECKNNSDIFISEEQIITIGQE